MAGKKWSEMTRIINPTDDTELCILDGNPLMNKRIKKVDFLKDSLSSTLKTKNYIIDTGDFFPPATTMFPFFKTPGSYGVVFTDPPIVGLNETNFNLKVDYVSHDGSGGDGGQDFIHTLTTATGRVFIRRVYMDNQQVGYVSTQFVEINAIKGEPGNDGIGVIPGGLRSQVLTKKSDSDYDTEWSNTADVVVFSLKTGTRYMNVNNQLVE